MFATTRCWPQSSPSATGRSPCRPIQSLTQRLLPVVWLMLAGCNDLLIVLTPGSHSRDQFCWVEWLAKKQVHLCSVDSSNRSSGLGVGSEKNTHCIGRSVSNAL